MNSSNVCRHLRAKKMYIPAEAEEAFSDSPEHASGCGHCWCNRTMAEVGPDDRQIGALVCRSGRRCFEE